MGEAKNRQALRREFFAQHAMCIFCGGEERAITEDHIPPRSLFRERKWPEGYVFPACMRCNQASKDDENFLAAVLRLTLQEPDKLDRRELRKHLDAARNNFPLALASLRMNTFEKRSALRKHGLQWREGRTASGFPMFKLEGTVLTSINRFMFKLGCALHYKYIGKPLSINGFITSEFRTNVANYVQPIPESILALAPELSNPKRNQKPLADQFTYRFDFNPKIESGVFICIIRKSFYITLLTIGRPSLLGENSIVADGPSDLTIEIFLQSAHNG